MSTEINYVIPLTVGYNVSYATAKIITSFSCQIFALKDYIKY